MRRLRHSRLCVAAALAAGAAALLAGCTSSSGQANRTPSPSTTTVAPGSSAGAQSASPAAARPSGVASSPSESGGCASLTVPESVKQAVTSAYGHQTQPALVHIAPVNGAFYYGRCGQAFYAATRFRPISGATLAEQVALQDDGATMKYFSAPAANGAWTYVASDGLPAAPRGCAAIPQIPAPLAALWGDCLTAYRH